VAQENIRKDSRLIKARRKIVSFELAECMVYPYRLKSMKRKLGLFKKGSANDVTYQGASWDLAN